MQHFRGLTIYSLPEGTHPRPGVVGGEIKNKAEALRTHLVGCAVAALLLFAAPALLAQTEGSRSDLACPTVAGNRKLSVSFGEGPSSLESRRVAQAWCSILLAPEYSRALDASPLIRWSAAHRALNAQNDQDLALAWVIRSFHLVARRPQFLVEVLPQIAGRSDQFRIINSFIRIDSLNDSTVIGQTHAFAKVLGDTVEFSSALALARSEALDSLETENIRFVALGGARIDRVAAQSADSFVSFLRDHLLSHTRRTVPKPLYFVTPNDIAAANRTLGILLPVDTVPGFFSWAPDSTASFLWAGSVGLGERYKHELVHLAMLSRVERMPRWIEEGLALALGGTFRQSFDERMCDTLDEMLRIREMDSPSFFVFRRDTWIDFTFDANMAAGLVFGLLNAVAAERVATLLERVSEETSFSEFLTLTQEISGVSRDDLIKGIDARYGPPGRDRLCAPGSR